MAMSAAAVHEYTKLLQEYSALLQKTLHARQEMLTAIVAGKLSAVQKAMNDTQPAAMGLEKLETRRLALQTQNGLTGGSIIDVVESLAPTQKAELLPLASRIAQQVEEIRFLSEKTLGMAQCTLAELDPKLLEPILQKNEDGTPPNPYEKQRQAKNESHSIETKA